MNDKLLEWNKNLSVGVEKIDQQHKELIEILNKLYLAMKQGQARDEMGKIFLELVSYTECHFKMEETFFQKCSYPQKENHKKKHDELRREVIEIKTKFENNKINISIELMHFLKDWVKTHIAQEDVLFGEFLSKQDGTFKI